MRETCAVIILERKAKCLRREKNDPSIVSILDSRLEPKELFLSSIARPFKLLCSPIVFLMSANSAICYGYLFLLFTTFTIVFEEQYGFSGGIAGLTYLGVGVGLLVGVVILRLLSDKIVTHLSRGGEMKPEYRLPIMIFFSPLLPVGLFWYGWSAQAHTHWIVPIIGTAVLATGLFSIFVSCMTYLIDAFPRYGEYLRTRFPPNF
ncbi:hypothetical protein Plec18167_004975 [Paecilomyces lecythidis]|uniref:Uncharacterized protein n=1 Tax=Paecilomyces lecythidis TaxID=3004212 RepID=A0ABR3XNJ9_9EURO